MGHTPHAHTHISTPPCHNFWDKEIACAIGTDKQILDENSVSRKFEGVYSPFRFVFPSPLTMILCTPYVVAFRLENLFVPHSRSIYSKANNKQHSVLLTRYILICILGYFLWYIWSRWRIETCENCYIVAVHEVQARFWAWGPRDGPNNTGFGCHRWVAVIFVAIT